MTTPGTIARSLTIVAVLGLAACSPSDGDGGGPGASGGVRYTGSLAPAEITKSNATTLGSAALSADESSFVPFVSAAAAQQRQAGAAALTRQLLAIYHRAGANTGRKQTARVTPFETTTEDCSDSGRIQVTETETTARFVFDACDSFFGLVIDGEVRATGAQDDITITYSNLNIRASGIDITLGGTMRGQVLSSTRNRVTLDFVVVDNLTGRQAAMTALRFATTENTDGSLELTLDGRLYDSLEGYVDIVTAQTLVFEDAFANYPASGQFVLTGNGGQHARITALDASTVRIELDVDPVDGDYETVQDFLWSELASGAVID